MSERICSKEEMEKVTTIEVKRRTSSKLQILKHQLGFKSVDEMLTVFMSMVYANDWRKEDLIKLSIRVESGSAKTDSEVKLNLGILTQTTKIEGKVKPKPKEKKKEEAEK
jgi:hypothetical protein